MNKHDETYQAVKDEIERVGGTVDDERMGNGSHRLIYWSKDGRQFLNTVSAYAGNWRSRANAKAEVRAKLKGTRK